MTEIHNTKICKKCVTTKLFSEFYKEKRNTDGYTGTCIKCTKERLRGWLDNNKEKSSLYTKKYKKNNVEKILLAGKKYYENNKGKIALYSKSNRHANKEKEILRHKKYRNDNKEKIILASKKYLKNNREKINANKMRYKATKIQATPLWFEKDKVELVYKKALEWNMHVDHIVPLKGKNVCGLHCWANLQLLEASLNKSKGNRIPT